MAKYAKTLKRRTAALASLTRLRENTKAVATNLQHIVDNETSDNLANDARIALISVHKAADELALAFARMQLT